MRLQPYGANAQPVRVTKQFRLSSVEFKTAHGGLLLRGLRMWVDESVSAVELTLGAPMMSKLGYDNKDLFDNASRHQVVWDFDDGLTATTGAARYRSMRVAVVADEIDDADKQSCGDVAAVSELHTVKVGDTAAEGL
ncbi:hypothetical protein H310_15006 [Aphanomyces invadans]|uniref:Uncharacterized protein n=1 Tax=Aphanomyces invadans TaxID=157072 RepID=A0A024T9X6_9STRA|nr:hypothetical protein H310_15006 [Aphanomyces invadans]ETV90162.1 hypothetical protein H310_15006 [Aphanomyces invadans]|eukprot:XP_008881208.1 hypothetical protein H310_15006 [Aphanomyces invadans]